MNDETRTSGDLPLANDEGGRRVRISPAESTERSYSGICGKRRIWQNVSSAQDAHRREMSSGEIEGLHVCDEPTFLMRLPDRGILMHAPNRLRGVAINEDGEAI
jgi:hypothetical protein